MSKPTQQQYIEFEGMDRASTLMTMLKQLLGDHQSITEDVKESYDHAELALINLYQKLAEISFKE